MPIQLFLKLFAAFLVLGVVVFSSAPGKAPAPEPQLLTKEERDRAKAVLQRVPEDAKMFAHAKVRRLRNGPLGGFYEDVGRDFSRRLKEFQTALGVTADDLETVTYFKQRQSDLTGPDQTVLLLTTTRPAAPVKPPSSGKKEPADGSAALVPLGADDVLLPLGEQTFAVAHKTLINLAKGSDRPEKRGPLADALALAERHHYTIAGSWVSVWGVLYVPDQLGPLVQPLRFPAMVVQTADWDGQTLRAQARVTTKDEHTARATERAAHVLLYLGATSFAAGVTSQEVKALPPARLSALKAFAAGLDEAEVGRAGTQVDLIMTVQAGTNLLPALFEYREMQRARGGQAWFNLKQIGLAIRNYHDTQGRLPTNICDRQGKPLLSWRVALLPFLGEDALYRLFHLDEPWNSEHNQKVAALAVRLFNHPNQQRARTFTHYRAFFGNGAAFERGKSPKLKDFSDGPASTILVVEAEEPVEWTKPDELAYDPNGPLPRFAAFQRNGFNAVFADGSVRLIPRMTSEKGLRAWITRNGGEKVEESGESQPPPGEPGRR